MSLSDNIRREFEYWRLESDCEAVLEKYYAALKTGENQAAIIKEAYEYLKQVTPEFYVDGRMAHMHLSYFGLRNYIIRCECRLNREFIADSTPAFEFFDNKNPDQCLDPGNILDYIVHEVRRYLVLIHSFNRRVPTDINKLDFTNDCLDASNKVKALCDQLWLESDIVGIYPGYLETAKLYDGNGFHMFCVVKIEGEYYLVDCTYRQFFTFRQNFLEMLGVVDLPGCKAGRFMTMEVERQRVADKILRDGWIKLEGDVLKHYLDGFTISFRNGLYYEQTGDFSYTTNYGVDDYVRFLTGEDNQLNHEDRECLGYQKKPLKNSRMSFQRRN